MRFFVSGHSLTDNPFSEYLAAIAESQGTATSWNQQIAIGSPISWRTRGDTSKPGNWLGYGMGKNRGNKTGLNVLQEFAAGAPRPYDTLIVTEAHKTVSALIWNDTVRHLRHFHERLIAHNPAGRTFLFEPWESVVDASNPAPWLALERQATTVWACVATRINTSLVHEGRADRIATIPAGSALAELVSATIDGRIPGLKASTPEAAFKLYLTDDVHLTPLGRYFVALVSAGTVSGRSIEGVWAPPGMASEVVVGLQRFAQSLLAARAANVAPSLEACRTLMTTSFCDAWNAYVPGKWASRQDNCKSFFGRATMAARGREGPNPFAFEPVDDTSYWFAAP